ncbi:MAG: hypothetical protein ABI477_14775 [Chryseolinea sp.]
MMIRLLLLLIVATPSLLSAQTKIKSVALPLDVASAAVDRPGEIYVTSNDGTIRHYDIDGGLKAILTGEIPDLFEPRDGSRLFAFYRKGRHYDLINPSFEVSKSLRIDSSMVVDPLLVCPSGDYNIWAIDVADKTLKKIDPATSAILVEVELNEFADLLTIKSIREYQGFLFIHDSKKGLIIFSGMGKQLKKIGDSNISYFNFIGEELYYKIGNQLQLFNLFTTETRSLPLPQFSQIALITDERLYLLGDKTLEIFTPIH